MEAGRVYISLEFITVSNRDIQISGCFESLRGRSLLIITFCLVDAVNLFDFWLSLYNIWDCVECFKI